MIRRLRLKIKSFILWGLFNYRKIAKMLMSVFMCFALLLVIGVLKDNYRQRIQIQAKVESLFIAWNSKNIEEIAEISQTTPERFIIETGFENNQDIHNIIEEHMSEPRRRNRGLPVRRRFGAAHGRADVLRGHRGPARRQHPVHAHADHPPPVSGLCGVLQPRSGPEAHRLQPAPAHPHHDRGDVGVLAACFGVERAREKPSGDKAELLRKKGKQETKKIS